MFILHLLLPLLTEGRFLGRVFAYDNYNDGTEFNLDEYLTSKKMIKLNSYKPLLEEGDSTFEDLKSYLNEKMRISVAGQIENYSKWPLVFDGYARETGQFSLPPRSTKNGTIERWAQSWKFNTA